MPARPVIGNPCECDAGWYELIADLIRELIQAGWTREISQIKEKFGGLRFYASGLPENGHEIIKRYEERALKTCEICGSEYKVKLRGYRWVKTLCHNCAGPWLERHYCFKLRWIYGDLYDSNL